MRGIITKICTRIRNTAARLVIKTGGFIFRAGVRIKDFGERIKCNWLIRLGFAIREAVLNHGKAQ